MGKVREILKDFDIYYPNENLLSEKDKETFFRFIQKLSATNKVIYTFRGESNLDRHYCADISNIRLLSDHIFMLGEKSKTFYSDYAEDEQPIEEFIYDTIEKSLVYSDKYTDNRIPIFKQNNPDFVKYFLGDNREAFCKFIRKRKDRDYIIDYYIAFIHTIDSSIKNADSFVSTTTCHKTALGFRGENPEEAVVIFCWLPKEKKYSGMIKCESINVKDNRIAKLGLPTYDKSLSEEHKEMCMKYGILPHFILGYQVGNDKFIINPNVLKNNSDIDTLVKFGLDIDQSNFKDYISQSNYRRSFVVTSNGIYKIKFNEN